MTMTSFPVKELDADLCVVGGGMAGVCAALAAARNGIRTILVQDRPVLGGNASSEIRMHICGAHGVDCKETGILEELLLRNLHYNPMLLYETWDHILYGVCMEEERLTTLLNCSVHGVIMAENKIDSVQAWHLTAQCRYTIRAKLFADCSGDSALRVSGAQTRWGREGRDEFGEGHAPEKPDRKTMGNSILIQLRATNRHIPFLPPPWAHRYTEETVPQRTLQPAVDNFWWLEVGGTQDTIVDADIIRDELLRIAYGVWAYIKNHPDGRGHGWELDWIGSLPGKRENVRYVGDYILTQRDVEAEGRFDDLVAYGGWSMDDHHPDAIHHPGEPTIFHPAPSPYGIPYRVLYSRNIENLFFAGRNISATHMAMSSTRVMATCALMGQAVGTAAAIAVRNGHSPRGVYTSDLRQLQATLMEQDAYLPWHSRSIPALSRSARLSATKGDAHILLDGVERNLGEEDHGWWGAAGESVSYQWPVPVNATRVRIVFDSDLSLEKRMLSRIPPNQGPAVMPSMLARDFVIETQDPNRAWSVVAAVTDNDRRLHAIPLEGRPILACRLRLLRSWGGEAAHVFGFDVAER